MKDNELDDDYRDGPILDRKGTEPNENKFPPLNIFFISVSSISAFLLKNQFRFLFFSVPQKAS